MIGKYLKLEGFNQYIKPNLEKHKTEIKDILSYEENGKGRVLVALIGDVDINALERIVKTSIEEAFLVIKKDYLEANSKNDHSTLTAFPTEIVYGDKPLFKTIGLYQNNKTASKVFQNLAGKYSLIDLKSQLKYTDEILKDFGEKFKNF